MYSKYRCMRILLICFAWYALSCLILAWLILIPGCTKTPQAPEIPYIGWHHDGYDLAGTAFCPLPGPKTTAPYVTAKLIRQSKATKALCGDVLGDGKPYIVSLELRALGDETRYVLSIRNAQLKPVCEFELGAASRCLPGFGLQLLGDVDNDSRPEIIIVKEDEELGLKAIALAVVDNELKEVKTFGPVLTRPEEKIADLLCLSVCDLDRDGANEAILFVELDCGPNNKRFVIAVDCQSAKQLWRYELGPRATSARAADIDGDGRLEVVIGTSAPSNGFEANNTDDSHCYVIAFDAKGNHLWTTPPLGGFFCSTDLAISDLERDGEMDIVVAVNTAYPQREDAGGIFIVDERGEILRRGEMRYSLDGLGLADVNGDAELEIVTGGSHGNIHVFDPDLNEKAVLYCGSPVAVSALVNLDGDPRAAEVIATTDKAEFVIADLFPVPKIWWTGPLLKGSYARVFPVDVDNDGWIEIVGTFAPEGEAYLKKSLLQVWQTRPQTWLPAAKTKRRLIEATDLRQMEWSPDGKRFALLTSNGELLLADSDGTKLTPLNTCPPGINAIRWSPDSRRIAMDTERFEVWVTALSLDAEPEFVKVASPAASPTWSSDSRRLAFSAFGEETWDICTTSVAQQAQDKFDIKPLPPTATPDHNELAPSWSPDGKRIAFIRDDPKDITYADLDNQQGKVERRYLARPYLLDLTEADAALDVGRTASLPCLASDADISKAISDPTLGRFSKYNQWWADEQYVMGNSVDIRALTQFADAAPSERRKGRLVFLPSPLWSPLGDAVAFRLVVTRVCKKTQDATSTYQTPRDIWMARLNQRGNPILHRTTRSDDLYETDFSWSKDGHFIAYQTNDESVDEIEDRDEKGSYESNIRIAAASGETDLFVDAGWNPRFSPDSPKTLVYLKPDGLWLAEVRAERVPLPSVELKISLAYAITFGFVAIAIAITITATVVTAGPEFLAFIRSKIKGLTATQSEILSELIFGTQCLSETTHSTLKSIRFRPTFDVTGKQNLRADLENYFSPAKAKARGDGMDSIFKQLNGLESKRHYAKWSLPELSGETRNEMHNTLNLILAGTDQIRHYSDLLSQHAASLSEIQSLTSAERNRFTQRTLKDIERLETMLSNSEGPGLMQRAERLAGIFQIKDMISRARDLIIEDAGLLNVTIAGSPIDEGLLLDGDPEQIVNIISDIFRNSLEAIERKREYLEGDELSSSPTDSDGESVPSEGRIAVAVEAKQKVGTITIEDSGCGLPPEAVKKINAGERYTWRDEEAAEESIPAQRERGHGLPLAKAILRRYGGDLSIASDGLGKGTTVTIRLGLL